MKLYASAYEKVKHFKFSQNNYFDTVCHFSKSPSPYKVTQLKYLKVSISLNIVY